MKRIKIVLQFRSQLFEKIFDTYMALCVKEIYNENSLAISYTFFLSDDKQESDIIKLLDLYNKKACQNTYAEAGIELVCVYNNDNAEEKVYHKSFKPNISEYFDKATFDTATKNDIKYYIKYDYKLFMRACNIIGAILAILLIIVMLLYYAIKFRILIA